MQQSLSSLSALLLGSLLASIQAPNVMASEKDAKSIYDFTMTNIDGKDISLSAYKGKVLLIVNVASRCGFTPQYEGLDALFSKYKDQGFMILGFPANNFGAQEPGTDPEIKAFCSTKYHVTFDMFSKISVKGDDQHPLYRFLTLGRNQPRFSGDIRWNFQKYLVDREGNAIAKFDSAVKPLSDEVTSAVGKALMTK